MVVGLSSLTVICLLGLPLCTLALLLPAAARQWLGRRLIALSSTAYLNLLRLLGLQFRIDSLDALRDQGPIIVVANHPSLLDAVIILSRLPNACCVMKAALGNSILFGPIARMSGYISNEDPMALVRSAQLELKKGFPILIFPEGTRTVTELVNEFGKTTALIATRAGVPVQTVFIRYSSRYLGKRWPLFKPPNIPLSIDVVLGDVFRPDHPSNESSAVMTNKLERYYRAQMRSFVQDR